MQIERQHVGMSRAQIVILTTDAAFEEQARAAFGANSQVALTVVSGTVDVAGDDLILDQATVAIVDLDASSAEEMHGLGRLMNRVGSRPPVVVITQGFDAAVARTLLQMRVADFMVKPVALPELMNTCARVAKSAASNGDATESEIYTFLPAAGGAGVTTLAVQTAMTLLRAAPHGKSTTCLVDLDFQHGACADYLDIEPRLNLSEIEPRPDRLDRQLLEVMLSHHASGLAVIAAPNRPAEMRSFDPDVVTRLLDMVSSNFDYVVFDMPRTWFSWTDNVLLGSNKLFIVSEMTVPGLRHAKQLVEAIRERLGDGPRPQVIINRFEQKMFSSGLRKNDIERVLGDAFACCIPNDYSLVREAIDRGLPLEEIKPGNKISLQIKKLVAPATEVKPTAESGLKRLKLSWAR